MAEYVFITTTVMGVYTVYRLGSLFYKNMKKNKKFQKDQLVEEGYTDIQDIYADRV